MHVLFSMDNIGLMFIFYSEKIHHPDTPSEHVQMIKEKKTEQMIIEYLPGFIFKSNR
jgi:hypothetical protein